MVIFELILTTVSQTSAQASDHSIASVYTSLSQPACKTTSVSAQGAESVEICPGIAGYKLLLLDSDGRMSLTLRDKTRKEYPLDFWNKVTTHFSTIGKKAEWRIRGEGIDKEPVGLIVPLDIQDMDTGEMIGYYAVIKITKEKTCFVRKFPREHASPVDVQQAADGNLRCEGLSSAK